MSENNDFVSRLEFNKERGYFDERLRKTEKETAVLQKMFENLKDLPSTMSKLDKNLSLMGENLKALNNQFDKYISDKNKEDEEQSSRISQIDEKSKVDFIEWIKHNWTTIVLSLATLGLMVKDYIK